jgi:hypothetical protein
VASPPKVQTPVLSEDETGSSEEVEEIGREEQKAPKEKKPKIKEKKNQGPVKKKPIVKVVQFYVFNKHPLPEYETLPVPQLYYPPDGSPTSDQAKNLLKKAGAGLLRQQTLKSTSVR